MRVFPIGDILKAMGIVNIGNHLSCRDLSISLPVLNAIPDSQGEKKEDDKTEASQQNRECEIISWRIFIAKHLWADRVTRSPEHEVTGNDD